MIIYVVDWSIFLCLLYALLKRHLLISIVHSQIRSNRAVHSEEFPNARGEEDLQEIIGSYRI